jgi:hypothetical protein
VTPWSSGGALRQSAWPLDPFLQPHVTRPGEPLAKAITSPSTLGALVPTNAALTLRELNLASEREQAMLAFDMLIGARVATQPEGAHL